MSELAFYLASASPRRRELLRQVGLSATVRPSGIEEQQHPDENPSEMVLRLATAKAVDIGKSVARVSRPACVLAADTAVVVDREVLGKPVDDADALRMLRRLNGRTHDVMTGVCLLRTDRDARVEAVETTRVTFRSVDEPLLLAYVRSGEGADKAGAYAVQGRGALLVESISGSWANVVGLPVERLPEWFGELGLGIGDLLDW